MQSAIHIDYILVITKTTQHLRTSITGYNYKEVAVPASISAKKFVSRITYVSIADEERL